VTRIFKSESFIGNLFESVNVTMNGKRRVRTETVSNTASNLEETITSPSKGLVALKILAV
jgi:hypothetical protein